MVCRLDLVVWSHINNTVRKLHGGTHPLTDRHQVDDHFLERFMSLLLRVAHISDFALPSIVHAGYLDAMLFLAKHGFVLERVYYGFKFSLDVIRYLQYSL